MASVTAAERQIAKSAAFGLLYGAGPAGLRSYAKSTYGLDLSLQQATQIRLQFFNHYRGLREWHRNAHAREKRITEGRTVLNRRRLLHVSSSGNPQDTSWNAFQMATNFVVQGSAADVLKAAMLKVAERLPSCAKLRACVHDELILTAPTGRAEEVKVLAHQAMIDAFTRLFPSVPIEVEAKVVSNWGEK